jgi:UDP-N-acetylglucosamine 2-epimerase (non-hydrolysing)
MPPIRLLIVFGTRPEVIKLAPLVWECRKRRPHVELQICHAGQHVDIVAPLLRYFNIEPDRVLATMRPGQTLSQLAARCLAGFEAVLDDGRPDYVVVQGDTTTALVTALASFYRRIPVVHIEAGLRSGDLGSPWPEEMHRSAIRLLAARHCAPTRRAAAALLAEGVPAKAVRVTGNTVLDALLATCRREKRNETDWRNKYAWLGGHRLVLVTGHRRENLGPGIERVCQAVRRLACEHADVRFLYAIHPNPAVVQSVQKCLAGLANVHLQPPPPYPEFVWLMQRSHLLVTDSGGIQEEAPSLRRPVVITRARTERPEVVEAGAAVLAGTNCEAIVAEVTRLLTDEAAYASMQIDHNPYGDGRAAYRSVEWILAEHG